MSRFPWRPRKSLEQRTREVMAEEGCDWYRARKILGKRGALARKARAAQKAPQHGQPATVDRYAGSKVMSYRADIDGPRESEARS
jgi:hypothetical protein